MDMIRHVRMNDIDQLVELEASCFPLAEAATRTALEQRIQIFPHNFLVMEHKGQIIAMINGCVCDQKSMSDDLYENAQLHKPTGSYQAVFGLDVHPAYRHLGYAKDMMQALIKQSIEDQRTGMFLTCKQHLIGFYESFGYVNMGISASIHGGVTWYDMLLTF